MSANKKLPRRRQPNPNPIDLEADASGLVEALIRIKISFLNPYIDDQATVEELGTFKVDNKYIPDEIIGELALYQQYLYLFQQQTERNQFMLNYLLRSVCIAFFKHGYNMALDDDDEEFDCLFFD